MAKKVKFVSENPSSTLLWRYVPLRELRPTMLYHRVAAVVMDHVCACVWVCVSATEKLLRKMKFMKVTIHLGCYGGATPKAAPRAAYIVE